MMKALVLLGMLLGAASQDQAMCALDGAKAVSQLSDVVTFLWAATERCGPHGNSEIKCAIDIASGLKAVNDMVLVITEAVENCAEAVSAGHDCGVAVGALTGASAQLVASSGGIEQDCKARRLSIPDAPRETTLGQCFTSAKDAVEDLFKAILKISKVSAKCEEGSAQCARNSLNIIGFFADMGAALGHAVNDCGEVEGKAHNEDASCAAASLSGLSALHTVVNAGVKISQTCKVDEAEAVEIERKYQLERVQVRASSVTPTLMMAAFLPIFAVLGFFAGSKFAKGRMQSYTEARDIEVEE